MEGLSSKTRKRSRETLEINKCDTMARPATHKTGDKRHEKPAAQSTEETETAETRSDLGGWLRMGQSIVLSRKPSPKSILRVSVTSPNSVLAPQARGGLTAKRHWNQEESVEWFAKHFRAFDERLGGFRVASEARAFVSGARQKKQAVFASPPLLRSI